MDYDFSNGPCAITYFEQFSGDVSYCLNNIEGFLDEIIRKKGEKPSGYIGDKITKFSELHPAEEKLVEDMRFLNDIRVILQHGKLNRKTPDSDLECAHRKGKISITNELAKEFHNRYLKIYNKLIEIKR